MNATTKILALACAGVLALAGTAGAHRGKGNAAGYAGKLSGTAVSGHAVLVDGAKNNVLAVKVRGLKPEHRLQLRPQRCLGLRADHRHHRRERQAQGLREVRDLQRRRRDEWECNFTRQSKPFGASGSVKTPESYHEGSRSSCNRLCPG